MINDQQENQRAGRLWLSFSQSYHIPRQDARANICFRTAAIERIKHSFRLRKYKKYVDEFLLILIITINSDCVCFLNALKIE